MQFNVPQFIEYETKVVGPLAFGQFIIIGTVGVIGFLLYFFASFTVFLIVTIVLGGIAIALAFLKIGGLSLPAVLANVLKFSVISKIYIWQKKEQPGMKIYKKGGVPIKASTEEEGELPLKIAGNSRLKKLHTQIETYQQ